MVDEDVWRLHNAPEDLPTLDDIVTLCTRAGSNRNGVCIPVAGKPRFWAKYGLSVTRGSRGWVNKDPVPRVHVPEVYLIFSRGPRVYVLMELAEGMTFGERMKEMGRYGVVEMEAVASAVRRLTQIKMPADTVPGHIGGEYIEHDFFVECLSTLKYPTVRDLEKHINQILVLEGFKSRVDFNDEITDGLVLCPSDLDDSNFMIDSTGAIWAIDFGRTCFLPSSFMDYSLRMSSKVFAKRVANLLKFPKSDNFSAMVDASGRLVIFNDNSFGDPSSVA